MNEKILEEITVGLSDAEKNDLEEMIKAFKNKQSSAPGTPASENVQNISENLAQYGDILLKFDSKLKLLYGILRLSDQKNRVMNQRIEAVIELLKGQKILTDK